MPDLPAFIAVVDDEASICRALVRLLRSAHFRAKAFDSAAAFIDSLSTQAPDCLLLDLQMPKMSGVEVQEYLAREKAQFPVIIITAYDEPETAQRCMKLGASLFLRKPIEAGVLIKSIRKLVAEGKPSPPQGGASA